MDIVLETSGIVYFLRPYYRNNGLTPDLYFWRNNTGIEIDLMWDDGNFLTAIEIKSGKTFTHEFLQGLESWLRFSEGKPENCMVIYAGELRITHQGIIRVV